MIDLIVPCFNPARDWEKRLISVLHQFVEQELAGHREWLHLLIVNDGCTRHFDPCVLSNLAGSGLRVTVLHNAENKGKGYSIRKALAMSSSPYSIFMDADIPFGLGGLSRIFRKLLLGADVVAGVRTNSTYFQRSSFGRRQASRFLLFINRRVFRLPVTDSQTGLKGFNERGRRLLQKTTINRFLFDLEFMVMASTVQGLDISAVDVVPVSDLSLSSLSARVLVQESLNLFKIYGKKRVAPSQKARLAWH